MKTLAIFKNGEGIAITTKNIWEAWGKPAIQKMRMKLQLADKHLEILLGPLEGVSITTCAIKSLHTFIVLILGRKQPITSSWGDLL